MRLFAYLIPGLPQFTRGERVLGLSLGACAALLVLYMYWSNQRFLRLHGELRGLMPRSVAQEFWARKDQHKTQGMGLGLLLVLLSALDGLLVPGPRRDGDEGDAPEAGEAPEAGAIVDETIT